MELKVKKRTGKVVKYPSKKIKSMLGAIGFTGILLVKATGDVFNEAEKLAINGVISATNFEKALFKAVSNANKITMNAIQKATKKVLR